MSWLHYMPQTSLAHAVPYICINPVPNLDGTYPVVACGIATNDNMYNIDQHTSPICKWMIDLSHPQGFAYALRYFSVVAGPRFNEVFFRITARSFWDIRHGHLTGEGGSRNREDLAYAILYIVRYPDDFKQDRYL